MAYGSEPDENRHPLAGGRVVDAGSGPASPASGDSPEDVVRRLMDAEGAGHGHTPRARQPKAASGITSAKTSARPERTETLVYRLTAPPRRMIGDAFARVRTAVLSYRPTPRHMAILLVAVIALTMPWLIPALVLLGLVIVVVSYLSLGHDRSAELFAGWYGWLARRDPHGAEHLRARAARVSARLATWAGYLPDSWSAGLYLPDFSHPDEVPEKMADDPFERLAGDPRNR